ncbi:MAG: chromosome segregation protein SMC [Lachnoclostridium sp.]|jgi:chromosome segregation protein|nr:chromosome segregation protein SMC [Lachnoclostridium sp.]
MYLKSIEVQGFKSFANKLVFEFHNGITGIVGPNGSGKSNVADAVRWVLGEQSAKQLRGSNMQDIIFSGTETRKPQSYAYVALTITNEDHILNIPYEEVEVARRVYRSGESEYLLNGTVCRLRDVQELFFDTGIGKEGYSIIGQGQVDKILSGKPEERRELFDEAAGIVKFKKRKERAEKDLTQENQNLLRVKDVLEELERQVGPLQEQSDKAKEYLDLKEQLRLNEINLFLSDYDNYQEESKKIKDNIENAENELNNEKDKQVQLKKDYEDIDSKLDDFNREIDNSKNQINEDRLMLSKYENEINLCQQNIDSIIKGKEFSKERIDSLSQMIEGVKKEAADYERSVSDAKGELVRLEAEKQEADDYRRALSRTISEIEAGLSERNESVYTFMNETTEISKEQQRIESLTEQNRIRKAELSKKMIEMKTVADAAVEVMEKEKEALEKIRVLITDKEAEKQDLIYRLQKIRDEQKEKDKDLQEKQRSFHILTSKLDSLKNLTERYEGYSQSIRRVMEQKGKYPEIIGVVADIFQVEKKYETAVETALGGSIQNIITENETVAKEMIAFLKKNRYGRATFLPLTTVSSSRGKPGPEVLKEKGVIGNAASLVSNQPKYDGLIGYLLGRYILVDTIDHALALGKKYQYGLFIVTLEGELLSPGGSLSGGAYKHTGNLLGRHREIDALKEQIISVENDIKEHKDSMEEWKKKRAELQSEIEGKEAEYRDLQLSENTCSVKFEQAIRHKEEKTAEHHSLQKEGQEIEEEYTELKDRIQMIRLKLEDNQNRNRENKEAIEQLSAELENKRREEKKAAKALSEKHLEYSSFEQQTGFILENLTRVQNTLSDYEEEHFSYVEDYSHSDEKAAEMENTVIELNEKINRMNDGIREQEESVERITLQRDTLLKEQRLFFDKRDEQSNHISQLDGELVRLQAREEKLGDKISAQTDYIWNEYELTYIGSRQYRLEDGISYTKRKSKISDLHGSIREMGDVNVNAIEDYKNVKIRFETLNGQYDDLVESETVLRDLIAELDEEMKRQFEEKFAEIRVQFDMVFKELFGGGKGTLELMTDEEADVLDAGISIIAQPPGKKLKNMMQLSGGERALTAIALLFAIQNLKPSPFCLLDEIEAALDDSNVKRYAKYLHKLSKTTQFIVITHRQGTMSAADALYGITMQEKGVSTRVSVSLIDGK